jgi:16S rRNA processing protein RimM
MERTPLISVAKIVGPHGIKGFVKIRSFTLKSLDFLAYGPLYIEGSETPIVCKIIRLAPKGEIIATIDGVLSRNDAETLKGKSLFVDRSAMPNLQEDEYYYSDLVGMRIVDLAGEELGTVRFVGDFGGGDFLEFKLSSNNKVATLPFNNDSVISVDINTKTITINPNFILV